MKLIQISSGRGPAECELAAALYLKHFLQKYPMAKVLEKTPGAAGRGGYRSVLLELPNNEMVETGTVKWICPSPFRRDHKRKNWFIEVTQQDKNPKNDHNSSPDMIKLETFRSPGKGGQNVNKVETGVRARHLPTGLAATSTTARTQLQNKKLALERLTVMLMNLERSAENRLTQTLWREHDAIIRGQAFAVFEGPDFVTAS